MGNIDDFVNRSDQVLAITDFLKRPQISPRIEVWAAQPHSGITHFLKYCCGQVEDSAISLYADVAKRDGNTLFGQLGVEFYGKYPAIWRSLIEFQERQAGRTRTREMGSSMAASIPYVGRILSRGFELAYPTLPSSAYPSIAAEVFCEFLVKLSNNHQVNMFLDNVQDLDTSSADLLSVTVGRAYQSLRYVAAFISRNEVATPSADEFALMTTDIGYDVAVQQFPRPSPEFIKLYASVNGLQWSHAECKAIAVATGGDIYRIRGAIAAAGGTTDDLSNVVSRLPPLGTGILALLTLAQQDIRQSDILTLSMDDDTVFIGGQREIDLMLSELSMIGLIGITPLPDGDQLVALRPSQQTTKDLLSLSVTETTRQERRLYDYFSRVQKTSGRHSSAEVAPLLYRLAKRVDVEHSDVRLRDIIQLSLQMGSRAVAEEFVDRAISPDQPSQQSLQDYLAKLAFLISVKAFGRVIDLTSSPTNSDWLENRFAQIFRGIALNRRRLHDESEKLLARLCDSYDSLEELALLVSYRIVGRIHANDIVGARSLYFAYEKEVAKASNFGYFLRNGAEVFESLEGIEILTRALSHHEETGDLFGVATTLCNRGAKLAQTGNPESGLADVERAYDLLEVFGVHHLGIVIGDLAHCFLYLGTYEQAEATCRKALRYMGKDLPRFYNLTNLAASQLLQDQSSAAILTMDELVINAENAALDRVRQKVYLNAALINLFANAPASRVESLCVKALGHPDRRDPAITNERVATIRDFLESARPDPVEFLQLYSPCSLLYWYQNPLQGLPIDFLSFETMIENTNEHFSM
jgi:tetratricopeptide (TPR) repeat protein